MALEKTFDTLVTMQFLQGNFSKDNVNHFPRVFEPMHSFRCYHLNQVFISFKPSDPKLYLSCKFKKMFVHGAMLCWCQKRCGTEVEGSSMTKLWFVFIN